MFRSIIFGCFVLLIVTQLSSCITAKPGRKKKPSKAERIMKCVEWFGNEDADFQEKMAACTQIHERKK